VAKKTKIDLINLDPKDAPQESLPQAQPEGSEPSGQKGIRMKKTFLLIAIGAALAVLGGSAVLGSRMGWIHIPGLSPSTQAKPPPPVDKQEMGQVVKLSSLVTNLKEEGGRTYVKTTIVLEVDKKAEAEIQSKMPILTDVAILTLSDKRLDDLKQPEAKDRLKQELLTEMNRHLQPRKITRLYFDEFLYQ